MNSVAFWIDNFRSALIVALLYIIKASMQKKSDQKIHSYIKKLEKENIILHHRLEKLIRGDKN